MPGETQVSCVRAGLRQGEEKRVRNLFEAGKLLFLDMAATLFFLVLYLLTHNVTLSVLLGMALGVSQIGWQLARGKKIDTMQWMSLFLVLGAGTVTLLTNDPRFVMVKPSVIYLVAGIVMLRRGWMNRYLPPVALELIPDIAVIFGYAWSGLMFFSAALNLVVALNFSVVTWSATMSIWGIASKLVLFLIGYATMRTIAVARRRRQISDGADHMGLVGDPKAVSAIADDVATGGLAGS
jgi:intracellular septation protein